MSSYSCIGMAYLLMMYVITGKVEPSAHTSSFNMGYLVSPYGYANGTGPIPVSMVSTQIFLVSAECKCLLVILSHFLTRRAKTNFKYGMHGLQFKFFPALTYRRNDFFRSLGVCVCVLKLRAWAHNHYLCELCSVMHLGARSRGARFAAAY